MSRMKLAYALAAPGEKIAAWDRFADQGTAWVGVYGISESGAALLGWERMPDGEQPARRGELRRAGVRGGWTCSPGPFVWVADAAGFAAWTADALHSELRDGQLVARHGTAPANSIQLVLSELGDDLGHRQVWAMGADGARLLVAEERDDAVHLDPTYDRINVMIDGGWATFLARDLAGLLGVAHQDDLPGGASSPAPDAA